MSIFVDRKYLGMMSFRLEKFALKKTDLYNFRCPFCGDSKKNKTKARAYVYRKLNNYFFKCHNCNINISFSNFLKRLEPVYHKQYVLECYTNGENNRSIIAKPDFTELKGNAFRKFNTISLQSIDQLDDDHFAKVYVKDRQIPIQHWKELFFAENYRKFLEDDFDLPEEESVKIPDDSRLVFLYKNESGEITHVSGRLLRGKSDIRYSTVKVSDYDGKKIYGLDRIDKSKRLYIVEGQIDSMFLDNCVASGDAGLNTVAEHFKDCDFVMVFDNQPRNADVVKQMERSIENGYKTVIFPKDLVEKDINDMVLEGHNVIQLVDDRTFQGLGAKLEFSRWRK